MKRHIIFKFNQLILIYSFKIPQVIHQDGGLLSVASVDDNDLAVITLDDENAGSSSSSIHQWQSDWESDTSNEVEIPSIKLALGEEEWEPDWISGDEAEQLVKTVMPSRYSDTFITVTERPSPRQFPCSSSTTHDEEMSEIAALRAQVEELKRIINNRPSSPVAGPSGYQPSASKGKKPF